MTIESYVSMKFALISGIICTACILINSTYAQDASKPWKIVTQWDNDLLTGTDRGYTNGARVALVRDLEPDQEAHNYLQRALYKASGAGSDQFWGDKRFSEDSLRFSWGIGLTQLMYTPDDPDALTAPTGERPYAGWLGIEFSLNVSDIDSVGSVTLSIGTTGKNSYGEEAQDWVHTNISDSPIYQGWDSQVPGEATLNLHLDRKQQIHALNLTHDWPIEFDGYYEWGAAIGNFTTNAYLGALIRAGYNLPYTYATPRVQLGSYGQALFSPENEDADRFSFYGFFGFRGTAVLHDITLDGPIFRDSDSEVDSKALVGELIAGVATRIYGADISLSQTTRSDEFNGQTGGNHRFGSVMFLVDFPF